MGIQNLHFHQEALMILMEYSSDQTLSKVTQNPVGTWIWGGDTSHHNEEAQNQQST